GSAPRPGSSRRSLPGQRSQGIQPGLTGSSCGPRRPCTASQPTWTPSRPSPGAKKMPRRTLAATASLSGRGLHTGADTVVSIGPAAPGTGIRFVRTDVEGSPYIAARVGDVRATERRTAIGVGSAEVQTVEHLLAALHAVRMDDVLVSLDGPEPPILDGSFLPWLDLVSEAGVAEQEGEPAVVRVRSRFEVVAGDARYVVSPARELTIEATIEWDHPSIGRQTLSVGTTEEEFRREIAPARTFGFVHE